MEIVIDISKLSNKAYLELQNQQDIEGYIIKLIENQLLYTDEVNEEQLMLSILKRVESKIDNLQNTYNNTESNKHQITKVTKLDNKDEQTKQINSEDAIEELAKALDFFT
jgi:hypothetical protein